MSLFLLAYLLVYGTMQVVFYFRIHAILPDEALLRFCLFFFLALMVAAPIVSRLLENSGHISLATAAAWVGFSWMGFVFLAFCFSFILFIMEGIIGIGSRLYSGEAVRPPATTSAAVLLIVCLALSFYGFYESRQLSVEKIKIETAKLPQGKRFTLVQVSDMHLGLILDAGRVKDLVQRIRELKPDMIVCTGDLADGNLEGLSRLAPLWSGLAPPKGAYAVSGNHETYLGLDKAFSFLKKFGFKSLQDEVLKVSNSVTLVGMNYTWKKRCSAERELLDQVEADKFTILLKHSPQVCPGSLGRIDLQLSGHTHKGQIFPFNLVVKIFYPYISGLYFPGGGSRVYVSRGTGTWGPQMRILSPPELTIIEIRSSNTEKAGQTATPSKGDHRNGN